MGTPPEPAASVVIPARNSAAVVSQQLAALAAQDFDGSWEVVVADNGSTDDTAAVVAAAAADFPVPLRVIDASRRPGANAARNDGIRASTGRAVLFCDSDDRVATTWVRAMVDALAEGDTAGGPLEFAAINPPEALARGFDVPSSIQEYRGFRYALSANLGVRRAVFERLGVFDERFVQGFDEVDFGYRVHGAGLTLVDAPDAVVHYRLRSSLRALVRQQYRYGQGSLVFHDKFPELHDPGHDPLLRRALTVAKQTAKLAASLPGPREVRDRRVTTWFYELGALGLTSPRRRRPR